MFPKIVGFPPKSSILIGFSIINHPFWSIISFWKYPFLGMSIDVENISRVFLLKMIILGCFGGTHIFGNTHIGKYTFPSPWEKKNLAQEISWPLGVLRFWERVTVPWKRWGLGSIRNGPQPIGHLEWWWKVREIPEKFRKIWVGEILYNIIMARFLVGGFKHCKCMVILGDFTL